MTGGFGLAAQKLRAVRKGDARGTRFRAQRVVRPYTSCVQRRWCFTISVWMASGWRPNSCNGGDVEHMDDEGEGAAQQCLSVKLKAKWKAVKWRA